MANKRTHLLSCSVLAALTVMQPLAALAQTANDATIQSLMQATVAAQLTASAPVGENVRIGPPSSTTTGRYTTRLNQVPALAAAEKMALLRQKVKYVFVLFQENRAFDFYFGTFPGAQGLFSQAAGQTPGFTQKLVGTDGTVGTHLAVPDPADA